jgi:Fe-S-cluster-containing dehydrogenase component
MKKCTLCVDRIYNETLPEEDREPACVRACPTGARAFGDLGDPDSDVSRSVADRGGFDLWKNSATSRSTSTCRLAPRRACRHAERRPMQETIAPPRDRLERLFAWIDQRLSD